MRGTRGLAAMAALLALGACATTAPVAGDDQQADGKSLAAKPGLGRIYVVHGDLLPTGGGYSPNAPLVQGGAGANFVVGAVAGAVGALASRPSNEPPKLIANIMPGYYFVDDKPIANLCTAARL